MLTGACLIVLAIVACMMGTDMKEAKVLYYDAEFELDDSFRVTLSQSKETASAEDKECENVSDSKKSKASGSDKPKAAKPSLRSVGKDADPVEYSAQEIYEKLDRK